MGRNRGSITAPLEVRFWSKVHKGVGDDCWIWSGKLARNGYPYLWDVRTQKTRKASHISWELANATQFPTGLFACHRCDKPACVNPSHLFLGTQRDNMRDAAAKGRLFTPHGRRTSCKNGHPLTGDNVIENTYGKRRTIHRLCRICSRARGARRRARDNA